MNAIAWIQENYIAIASGAAGLLTTLAVIARFTKNTKDDAIIAKILAWLNKLLAK